MNVDTIKKDAKKPECNSDHEKEAASPSKRKEQSPDIFIQKKGKEKKQKRDKSSKNVEVIYSVDDYIKAAKKESTPFVFLKTNNKISDERFVASTALSDATKYGWDESSRIVGSRNEKDAKELDFFLIYPRQRTELFLGSSKDILRNKDKQDFFFGLAIDFDPRNPSVHSLSAMAGLFHAGIIFPQDKSYAKKLLNKISTIENRGALLSNHLVIAAQFEEYLPHLKSFIELGADINEQSTGYGYALPTALFHGNFKAADILTKAGASLTLNDPRYGSAETLLIEMDKTDSE